MHFAIVSYTFPPSKEIGGRRWAKFSQHIAKNNHQVTVICANQSVNHDWYRKDFPGINFKLLPKCYPDWLSGFTKTTKEKLQYMFYTRVVSPLTKQNLFDRGYAWKKPMLQALEDLHQSQPIDIMVVTGAPFSLLYYGAAFKARYKSIIYVGDLRDPWTWGSYYGIPNLSFFKKKFQEKSELKFIEACDLVCYPTENMGSFLKEKYPDFLSKFYLLPHAYDPDKFPKIIKEQKRKGFIYGGSLYDGIEEYLLKLDKIVKANSETEFEWEIYTGTNYPLIDTNFANGKVSKKPLIPEEQLFQKISESAAYLAFFPTTDKDLISTKFFEIIYSQTPILYIGEEGEVGKFIRENRIGVHILPENMERELPQYLNGKVPFENGYFDVKQYTFSSVTQNFLNFLKEYKQQQVQSNSDKEKHVLLISYTFPPYPGIGGRRWAKFAKYMSRLGYTVHVIQAKNPFKEKSLWLEDIKNNDRIITYEIEIRYPKILLTNPTNFYQKFKYKAALFIVNLFTKGSPYDRGIFWKRDMLKKSEELIWKYKIENIISNCAPFSSAYYALDLKKQYKNLNLIVDFRDPWTWGKGYGFSILENKRLLFEKEKELEVMQNSDYILVPTVEMKNHIHSVYPKLSDKVNLVPHGFDKDEITHKPKSQTNIKRLIFYGSLYFNLDYIFKEIAKCFNEYNGKVTLDIYSSTKSYQKYFLAANLISESVNYHKPLLPRELFKKMDLYDFVLIVQPEYAKDFISTKIHEIIYTKTPIILISDDGELSDFIKRNHLGLCFKLENLRKDFHLIFESKLAEFKLNQFPIEDYSFEEITSNLTQYLK